ncbi:hypothetical protein M9H77_14071 [Catharanthus roseus]|uniref:Uncharacterized protein n=1 Tax=Catharanthus roseus TaxID=4058 RepID=A0ACC0BM95_CATRO|nr:hypothetical protein M9H77_14071 [Catharanthus roseus]
MGRLVSRDGTREQLILRGFNRGYTHGVKYGEYAHTDPSNSSSHIIHDGLDGTDTNDTGGLDGMDGLLVKDVNFGTRVHDIESTHSQNFPSWFPKHEERESCSEKGENRKTEAAAARKKKNRRERELRESCWGLGANQRKSCATVAAEVERRKRKTEARQQLHARRKLKQQAGAEINIQEAEIGAEIQAAAAVESLRRNSCDLQWKSQTQSKMQNFSFS